MKIFEVISAIIIGFLIVFIFDLIFAWPIMLLWNWLMPIIFDLPVITFWQSFGLMLLCSLLFNHSSNTSDKK